MNRSTIRVAALPIAATVAIVGLALNTTSASADTDPVTGGTTTIDLSLSTVTGAAQSGIVAVPTKPATVTYDPASKAVEYAFPVTGGDASTNTFYGTLKHAGGLIIADAKTRKSVTLNALSFVIQDNTISATPAGSATSVVLFDTLGNHDYSTAQPETFAASDVQVDVAGAKYLNKALGTTIFKPGQHVGSFATSFSNSIDAG